MQKKLILKWVPRIIHVNPLAFVIVCCFLALVGGVLFYSITSVPTLKQKANDSSSMSVETENDKRWYQNAPDAIVPRPITVSNTLQPESDFSRQKQAALKSAMDSPLKAPINDSPSVETRINTPDQTPLDHTHSLSEKENFLNQLYEATDDNILHQPLQKPFSPFMLQAGTLLPATLAGGMNSELPGQLIAIINQNVYDSISGRYLLVPQGSKLVLIYDANVTYGQNTAAYLAVPLC